MSRRDYAVEAVKRAFEVLRAFPDRRVVLRLGDISRKTGLSAATAFRMLQTLTALRAVEREGRYGYRCLMTLDPKPRYRLAYASQGEDEAFAQEWSLSVVQAAREQGLALKIYPLRAGGEGLLECVDQMVAEHVDLAIICHFSEPLAPVLSSRFRDAGIPLIVMGVPHAGAFYYGGDNYKAGRLGGRALGQWARTHWRGADALVVLTLKDGGPLLASRMVSFEAAAKEFLPTACRIVRIEVPSSFGASMEAVRRYLRGTRARRILVGAANDPCALGALRALEESGWEDECAVMGQGGALEARRELRRPHTRLTGTVAYFPERYGPAIVRMAVDILENRPVPPAVFTRHCVLTPANVDQLYPNDLLLGVTTSAAE